MSRSSPPRLRSNACVPPPPPTTESDGAAVATAENTAVDANQVARRQARPVKPLGTARRPTRSRTPTPNNPHPNVVQSPPPPPQHPTFATTSRPGGGSAASSLVGRIPTQNPFPSGAAATHRLDRSPQPLSPSFGIAYASTSSGSGGAGGGTGKQRSSSSSNTSSGSGIQAQAVQERRPWFPYPANVASAAVTTSSSSAPAGLRLIPTSTTSRRVSNTADALPSSSSSASSSASSYNSADLTSLNAFRRAVSAEAEEYSFSMTRGRPSRMMSTDAIMSPSREEEEPGRAYGTSADEHAAKAASGSGSSTDDEKERAHFQSVLKAFDSYLSYSLAANNARRRSYYALPRSHRLLLSSLGSTLPGPLFDTNVDKGAEGSTTTATAHAVVGGRGFKARLDEIDDRIRRNADILSQIVSDSRGFLGGGDEGSDDSAGKPIETPQGTAADGSQAKQRQEPRSTKGSGDSGGSSSDKAATGVREQSGDRQGSRSGSRSGSRAARHSHSDGGKDVKRTLNHEVDKVRSTIKQFVRDWSEEGASERDAAYDPILDALEKHFAAVSSSQRGQVRVLVPGAGLGRLAFEIAWLGFSCQGNEFSFYMLLASHFILNKTTRVHEHALYPFVHSSSNWREAKHMLRPVRIPDINPSDLPSHVDFSMVAGEFVEVYCKQQERGAWDAIATCFFIDTAHNFARYLEVINHVLPIGGVWINVGPLLWHYEGATTSQQSNDISIELTLDEAVGLIELMGFSIEEQRTLPPQPYTGNPFSMLAYEYSPEFWVARKVRDVTPAANV